ncbi:hypothetical protein ILYODFUR_010746 [Ilyodon furcidens]|uniref:Uncharacterized protein n=1 Tax=Ilyodon furcidens TaxID=33524 RepID=A0ABV0U4A7_9TELE
MSICNELTCLDLPAEGAPGGKMRERTRDVNRVPKKARKVWKTMEFKCVQDKYGKENREGKNVCFQTLFSKHHDKYEVFLSWFLNGKYSTCGVVHPFHIFMFINHPPIIR